MILSYIRSVMPSGSNCGIIGDIIMCTLAGRELSFPALTNAVELLRSSIIRLMALDENKPEMKL